MMVTSKGDVRPVRRALRRCCALFVAALLVPACYDTSSTELRVGPVYQAYTAVRVYDCPVPFRETEHGTTFIYERMDLDLHEGGRVVMTHAARVDGQAGTNVASGTYRREGFNLEIRLDSGLTRVATFDAEIGSEGRLYASLEFDGTMEFVPVEEAPPPPSEIPLCDA